MTGIFPTVRPAFLSMSSIWFISKQRINEWSYGALGKDCKQPGQQQQQQQRCKPPSACANHKCKYLFEKLHILLFNDEMSDYQIVEAAFFESVDCVGRSAYHRLSHHVEAGVEHCGTPGEFVESFQEAVV